MNMKRIVVKRYSKDRIFFDSVLNRMKNFRVFVCPVKKNQVLDHMLKKLTVHKEIVDITAMEPEVFQNSQNLSYLQDKSLTERKLPSTLVMISCNGSKGQEFLLRSVKALRHLASIIISHNQFHHENNVINKECFHLVVATISRIISASFSCVSSSSDLPFKCKGTLPRSCSFLIQHSV